jgi:hypothetical protein
MGDRYLLVSSKGSGNELDEDLSWILVKRAYFVEV